MVVINAKKIYKSFGKLQVLKDVNLEVQKGEVISIIGPSGSGKSTLLRCLNHLEVIDRGSIEIQEQKIANIDEKGHAIDTISDKEIRQICKRVGMVFQNFNLFPHKSVFENVIEAPITVNRLTKKEAGIIVDELLKKVGLEDKKNAYPNQLSGGQKQRVAIARALAMKPDIMLFDEPTSALDPELVGEVLNVIKQLAKEDMTLLIVTHEMTFAKEVSDKIIFMDEGRIIETSSPEKLFNNPEHPRIKSFINKMI